MESARGGHHQTIGRHVFPEVNVGKSGEKIKEISVIIYIRLGVLIFPRDDQKDPHEAPAQVQT